MNDIIDNHQAISAVSSPAPKSLSLGVLKLNIETMGEPDASLEKNKITSPTSITTEETSAESPVNKKISEGDDTARTDVTDDLTEHDGASEQQQQQQQHAHPALDALLLLDRDNNNRRIHPNGQLVKLENEWLEMDMLIMLRTPNVDDPSQEKGTARNQKLCQHFENKQRRFEFQYQGKLKKTPDDKTFCFCMELAESPKLNFLQKALVTACMAFMKKMSPSFHFNMETKTKAPDGKYETPHMAFEVDKVLDRLAITKPGETPPTLGETIPEDPERTKLRREGKWKVNWNTQDTYTMTIWSHYIDWLTWEVVHIPGVKHFSLQNVLGDQSVFMQMYLLDNHRKDKNKHYQKDVEHVVNLEFQQNPNFVRKQAPDNNKSKSPSNKKHKKKLFGK